MRDQEKKLAQDKASTKRTSSNSKQSAANDNRLRQMYAEGMSQNKMAKELGVGRTTVASWSKRLGLSFDATATVAMSARAGVDLAAGRIRLAEKMLAAAEKMVDGIDGEYLVYNFGGKDNTYEEHVLSEAPVEVKRNILTSAAIAFDKITRIVEADPDIGTAETAIRALQRGLSAAAEQLKLDRDTQTLLGADDEPKQ